jgi:hypothetical protein
MTNRILRASGVADVIARKLQVTPALYSKAGGYPIGNVEPFADAN